MNPSANCHGVATSGVKDRELTHAVALVGPPNSGKSTMFNRLTGLRQKVANFPGVTVEYHLGKARTKSGRDVTLIDLPGIYSMNPRSDDERVTHDVLTGSVSALGQPDAVILILDVTNLARHLLLAAPILSLGLPTLVVLNMSDDLAKRGGTVDAAALAQQLGSPVVLASGATGAGVDKIQQFFDGSVARPEEPPVRVELPVLQDIPGCRKWAGHVGNQAGYRAPAPPHWTRRLDKIFLHPLWGPLIFLAVVLLVFQSIFTGAKPLMDGINYLITWSGGQLAAALPAGLLRDLLIEGVWAGVGSVVVFLPQILVLFLFIGILEDSGYLARAALIADRTMARAGLQGKAFIPLLSAYACAIPAIMATRTIENKRDRLATILVAPFMTCSARLPVYTLLIAAFLPEHPLVWKLVGTRAAALLSLYIVGFLAAVGTAKLLGSSVLKRQPNTFVMEMPPYRMPSLRSLGLRMLDRAVIFLRRAGTVILTVAVVLWILAHLPYKDGHAPPIEQSVAGQIGHAVEPAIRPLGFNWKIGIGLISSLFAREVIIGTLGTIYGIENADETSQSLQQELQKDLTPGGALALLFFFAFAMQCFSTIAVVRRETGGWKWPAVQFAYMGVLAYVFALAANQAYLYFA